MQSKSITRNKRWLEREGQPFFYLADTAWSAFTSATDDEWNEYLAQRRFQGFTAVQINILPQWDRARRPAGATAGTGEALVGTDIYDPAKNKAYYDRVEAMTRRVVEMEMVPVLVVLWANYVPDNWCSKRNPNDVMPREKIAPYVTHIAKRLARYNPIWIVSGDTSFDGPGAAEYYLEAATVLKRESPDCLRTLHLCGDLSEIPDSLTAPGIIDFYTYQSSHSPKNDPASLSRRFLERDRYPLINSEPCYEGIGYFNGFGRFTRDQVRWAAWRSLLSGATAGITYGAFGIWNWHRSGDGDAWGGSFSSSFDWMTALGFPGAWDYGFMKTLWFRFGLYRLVPQKPADGESEAISVAASEDSSLYAAYLPASHGVTLPIDPDQYRITLVALASRADVVPTVRRVEGRKAAVQILPGRAHEDYLVVAERRR